MPSNAEIAQVEEPIVLPVIFDGKEYEFETQIVPFGYLHKVLVTIDGHELSFEMDEERNYRVIDHSKDQKAIGKIKPGLLHAIVEKLQSLHE